MKKKYESPALSTLSLSSESIMTASEENADINVGFDSLWGI